MRISDWSSDVCSSDLTYANLRLRAGGDTPPPQRAIARAMLPHGKVGRGDGEFPSCGEGDRPFRRSQRDGGGSRSEEHTSELQSLMRISYAVFCLKKKKQMTSLRIHTPTTTVTNVQ